MEEENDVRDYKSMINWF